MRKNDIYIYIFLINLNLKKKLNIVIFNEFHFSL